MVICRKLYLYVYYTNNCNAIIINFDIKNFGVNNYVVYKIFR